MDHEATQASTLESWVDAAAVGAHLGFKSDHVRKLAIAGKIPGVQFQNGARVYWRFKLSKIDEALSGPTITLNVMREAVPTVSSLVDISVDSFIAGAKMMANRA